MLSLSTVYLIIGSTIKNLCLPKNMRLKNNLLKPECENLTIRNSIGATLTTR